MLFIYYKSDYVLFKNSVVFELMFFFVVKSQSGTATIVRPQFLFSFSSLPIPTINLIKTPYPY